MTYEELTYEGFSPTGVPVMVNVLTDNRNRTSCEVRKIFQCGGGHARNTGCVGFAF
jgi:transcriptional/translational regulatory protein YebC/TACO1